MRSRYVHHKCYTYFIGHSFVIKMMVGILWFRFFFRRVSTAFLNEVMPKGRIIKEEGRMTGENQVLFFFWKLIEIKPLCWLCLKIFITTQLASIFIYHYKFLLHICLMFKLLRKPHCVCMQDRIFLVQLVSVDFSIIEDRKNLIQRLFKTFI